MKERQFECWGVFIKTNISCNTTGAYNKFMAMFDYRDTAQIK